MRKQKNNAGGGGETRGDERKYDRGIYRDAFHSRTETDKKGTYKAKKKKKKEGSPHPRRTSTRARLDPLSIPSTCTPRRIGAS